MESAIGTLPLPLRMDALWRDAPLPALRLWHASPARCEANAAARDWAASEGVDEAAWQALADAGPPPAGDGDGDLCLGPRGAVVSRRVIDLPDGQLWWLSPVPGAAPHAQGGVAIERSLSLLEHMQLVAEAIGVGFWWRDIEAGVFEWDEQMYRMHQRDPASGPPSLDEWVSRLVHPDDRGWISARQDLNFVDWTPASDVVFRTIAPDGSVRWIQAWTRRLMRNGHRISLGMHMDITERRRAEQRAELERQRDQFAIEAAGIGMWERLTDGEPIYWSPAMYRMRGLKADDPRPIAEIVAATMSAADDAEGFRRLCHCLATGVPFAYEFEVVWPNGTRRWLASSGRPIRDTSGRAVTVAGVNIDITERRRAEPPARGSGRSARALHRRQPRQRDAGA
jgi:PAS domain S-box-containing protein